MKSRTRANGGHKYWRSLTDAGITRMASKWNRRKSHTGRCPAGHNYCHDDDECSVRAALKEQLRHDLEED